VLLEELIIQNFLEFGLGSVTFRGCYSVP